MEPVGPTLPTITVIIPEERELRSCMFELCNFITVAIEQLDNSDEELSAGSYSSSDEDQRKIKEITLSLMEGLGEEEEISERRVWKNIESIIGEACNLGCQGEGWESFVEFRVNQEKNVFTNTLRFREEAKNFTKLAVFREKLELREEGKIEFSGADSHHGGKVPFQFTGNDICGNEVKVFVKPRKADLDIAILSLFERLNNTESKSIDTQLPIYKIENIENFSVWEFINGCEPGEGFKFISPFLDKIETDESVKTDLILQLSRLEQIAKAICLSDLHGENVIFTNIAKNEEGVYEVIDHEKPIKIVPIDLESIQEGQDTGLIASYEGFEAVELNEQEKAVIEGFRKELVNIPFRMVPVSTSVFINYIGDPNSVEEVQGQVSDTFQKKELNFSIEGINQYIVECFANKEVPFFTCIGNQVFPGVLK